MINIVEVIWRLRKDKKLTKLEKKKDYTFCRKRMSKTPYFSVHRTIFFSLSLPPLIFNLSLCSLLLRKGQSRLHFRICIQPCRDFPQENIEGARGRWHRKYFFYYYYSFPLFSFYAFFSHCNPSCRGILHENSV